MILASYNIHFAIGFDGRHDLDRLAANVRAADSVLSDHVLGSGSLRASVRPSWIERDGGASDHFPMFVDLDLGLL
jgi:endonuclease/exonuclease/phosphatase family metal-dependent hydrolase